MQLSFIHFSPFIWNVHLIAEHCYIDQWKLVFVG
ncbi:unnamed protein product [Brugia timori]|uniref:Uncharacterized protein n=1 Tax=Brugia timori TaxID=42155 RepID=A0A0R3Q4A4_9BILA|nr:unnamed protein product [Brugia timori]